MKKILLFTALVTGSPAFAQKTTAQDWTKDDCKSNSWNLYSRLDMNKVAVMEFVMPTGCYGCYEAANYLEDIRKGFGADSSRIENFAMAYNNAYTCSQLSSWANTYDVKGFHLIAQCSTELSYYGSMGMPTIAIAAGAARKVFYYSEGFVPADTTAIKNAILLALQTSSAEERAPENALSIFPNPAADIITIDIAQREPASVTIYSSLGELVSAHAVNGRAEIGISHLGPGVYYVQCSTSSSVLTKRIVKK